MRFDVPGAGWWRSTFLAETSRTQNLAHKTGNRLVRCGGLEWSYRPAENERDYAIVPRQDRCRFAPSAFVISATAAARNLRKG
jgi:hypothetical protein